MTPLWPHQQKGIDDVLALLRAGKRRICLTSPTGGGKTRIMEEIIRHCVGLGMKTILYTNRRLLLEQLRKSLGAIEHGVRAASHASDHEQLFQISSIQTEHARCVRSAKWQLFPAELVVIDEAHVQTGKTVVEILGRHEAAGAARLGVTATPLGIGGLYDDLVVAGTPEELRAAGAICMAMHFGPDEPDLKTIKGIREGEDLSEKQNTQAIMRPGLFGRVLDNFRRLNPENWPTVLFGPSVEGSLWFAQEFTKAGIPAAHVDGEHVWLEGQLLKRKAGDEDPIRRVEEGSRNGRLPVVCNRYVLREGVDWPWLRHVILATVYGSLASYLQSVGRVLRAYPGVSTKTIQDHGGNWWRHGSVNAGQDWALSLTNSIMAQRRAERIRSRKCRRCKATLTAGNPWCPACSFLNEAEGMTCPKCQLVLICGRCKFCGFVCSPQKKARYVVQHDGTLKVRESDVFRPRRVYQGPNAAKLWERMYYRSRTEKGQRTFAAAACLFARENRFGWPARNLPLMPVEEMDYFRLVKDVPMERLIPKP
jgi:superfamily II DNA or RNA helicase